MSSVFLESSMEDSFIYKSFNSSNMVMEKIVKYIKTGVRLDRSYIEEQYIQMKKIMISPMSERVIEAYDNGLIELLYSREVKVGLAFPFIVRRNPNGNGAIATIFISSFATIDKNDNLSIPVKQLYALMESAYVAYQMQINPLKIQRHVGLMKICGDIYVQMLMRILNKEYALNLDRVLCDKVTYCISRFFVDRVWEYPNKDLVNAYASSNLKDIDRLELDLLATGYEGSDIKTIDDCLSFIKNLSPKMSDLNTRYFIERFIYSFHGSSIMAIDYLPYIFFVIINIILSTFLISQASLNDLVKNTKNVNKFYSELSKLI